MSSATIRFDGASRGNPGKASSAAIMLDPIGRELGRAFTAHDKQVTCNVAEYLGLIAGLRLAQKHAIKRLIVEGDSKLVIEQVFGKWECRHVGLRGLNDLAKSIVSTFDLVDGRWIPRNCNTEADAMCNIALDTAASENVDLFQISQQRANLPHALPVRPSVFIKACAHRKPPYTKKSAPSILSQLGML